ncbi:Duffy binding-like1 [Cotesia plutellae polydnavirus]|nr:Duffy binding-like1 [Cotesia plutellae polydnavirus]
MRFDAKVVVVLATIVGVEWVRAAPPEIRCKENCVGHRKGSHVIGVVISQTNNSFGGASFVAASINQTDNNFRSGDGGKIEAAVIKQDNNIFEGKGVEKIIPASVIQHNNTFGGELIECGSSDCNSKIADGDNEKSKEEYNENGDSPNTSSGSSAPTNIKEPAGENQKDDGNEKSTNVPSGNLTSVTNKDTGCDCKKNDGNGDSVPAHDKPTAGDPKNDRGNEKLTNVPSGDLASVTNKDTGCDSKKNDGNRDSVPANDKPTASDPKNDRGNEKSTNVPSGNPASVTNKDTGCDCKKNDSNGDSVPAHDKPTAGDPKNDRGNEKSTNVPSENPASVTNKDTDRDSKKNDGNGDSAPTNKNDKPDEIKKGPVNENTTKISSNGSNTGPDETTNSDGTKGSCKGGVGNGCSTNVLPEAPKLEVCMKDPMGFPFCPKNRFPIYNFYGYPNCVCIADWRQITFPLYPSVNVRPSSDLYPIRVGNINPIYYNNGGSNYVSVQSQLGSFPGSSNPYGSGISQASIFNNDAGNVQIVQQSAPLSSYYSGYTKYNQPDNDMPPSGFQNSMYRPLSDEKIQKTGEPKQRVSEQRVDRANLDGTVYFMQPQNGNGGVVESMIINNNDEYGNVVVVSKSLPFAEPGPQYKPLVNTN